MKAEENTPQTGFFPQLQGQDGILLASEVIQTRPSFSMPIPIQPGGISVSIIEDDARTSQILSDWIRPTDGFCLVNYHNTAASALATLPNEKPSIALIDMDLPDFGALNCVRRLKPPLRQTQFVMLMADENVEKLFNALALGATGYLLTQTPRVELLAALRQIHAGGSPMSCSIAKKVLQSFQIQTSLNNPVAELSPRENRILRLLARGASCAEAADTLNLSLSTVSTFIRSIYEKLQLLAAAKLPQ